jgi:hypothetical protein
MATLLYKESICGWCGKDDAPLHCVCKQVCFCDATCQKKLWKDQHKLMCTEGKEKKDSSSYSTGDIVKIHGLRSEQGKRMNEHLAEIISFDKEKERYEVIFTMEKCVVKTALMKYENLAMHLSVVEGAKGCTRRKLSDMGTHENREELMNESKKVAKMFSRNNETGKNIMDRLKKNDKHLLQAVAMPGGIDLTSKLTGQLLQNGFLDWLFKHFEYPAFIDETNKPSLSLNNMLCVAMIALDRHQLGVSKEQDLNHYRVEACKKMAPLIMAVATKKRRSFQHVEYWLSLQFGFVALLENCLMAEQMASTVLLTQLDPFVTKVLLQHCVYLLSSNPKLNLKKKSGWLRHEMGSNCSNPALELQERSMKRLLMPVLLELMDCKNDGKRWVAYIGKISIPPGIKNYSHKSFASVIFHLFAQAVVDETNAAEAPRRGGQQLLEEVQYIYGCMYRCEALSEIMGPFNSDLIAVQTPSQLLRWANKTKESSP